MMKLKLFLFLMSLCFTTIVGMEEQPLKINRPEEQPYLYLKFWKVENLRHVGSLSLKYQAALKAYTACKSNLVEDQTVVQYLDADLTIPVELIEYLAKFEKVDHDSTSLGKLIEISSELGQRLKKRIFPFIDEQNAERKECLKLLTELCHEDYNIPEQRFAATVCLLLNRSASDPDHRLLLTHMLEIAIHNHHHSLVKFLVVNGAYLNKKNFQVLRPLIIAIRDNNLHAGKILIDAYLLRLQNKSNEIKITKMMNFLAPIRNFDHTPLSGALAHGNPKFILLMLNVALDCGLNLKSFMNIEQSVLWEARPIYSSMEEFKNPTKINSEDQVRAVRTLLDFALEHHVNINTILDLRLDWSEEHEGSSPAMVNFLRENAERYGIDPCHLG